MEQAEGQGYKMSTLFRSMPWNARPDWDTLGRVLVTGLLIVATLLLSVRSGVEMARGNQVTLLYLLIGGFGFVVLLARPELALFLIPIGVSLPRTMPRLFGEIGVVEALLPLAGAAWGVNLVIHRQRIRTNAVLWLALLAAPPIMVSAIAGRGNQDWARAYTWLGGCVTYLLALNLVRDRPTAERILFWPTLAVVGVFCVDFLTNGWVPFLGDISPWIWVYRKLAVAAGQTTFVAGLLAVLMPLLLAYALLAADRLRRLVAVIGIILATLLGVVLLARIFWVGTAFGLVAQVYVIWRKNIRVAQSSLAAVILFSVSIWLASLLLPTMTDLMRWRFEEEVASRMGGSVVQMGWAFQAPLWGYGSDSGGLSGFAHAMIPMAMYEYGLLFTLPLLGALGVWLSQAIRLVRQTDSEQDYAFSLAHLGVATGVVGIMFFNDFLVKSAAYLCLAFLIAGLLGATVSDQEQ